MTEIHKVTPGFIQTLKDSSILELAVLRNELKEHPEDKEFLDAVNQEIKDRATSSSPKVQVLNFSAKRAVDDPVSEVREDKLQQE